jgi:multidrug efflux system membrane fusion protein
LLLAGNDLMRFFLRPSFILAFIAIVLIALWMGSGSIVVSGTPPDNEPEAVQAEESEPLLVRVQSFQEEPKVTTLTIRGRTEPEAEIAVVAETSGQVVERFAEAGNVVKQGDPLCKLNEADRQARLVEAEARVEQARLDYDAARSLSRKGYSSQTNLRTAKASLDAASANLATAQLDLDRTLITAPIGGVVTLPLADQGTMLSVGDVCVTLVNASPLIMTGQVSERAIGALSEDMTASVELVTGQKAEGTLRFIAPQADQDTRTFRVEIAIPNEDLSLKSGITASAVLTLDPQMAFFLPQSVLTLSDEGQIGVRTVSDEHIVQFTPVTILGNETDGVWVKGMTSPVTVITVGQDFVKEGESVRTTNKDEVSSSSLSNVRP